MFGLGSHSTRARDRVRVIELIGPAGSGKSELARRLTRNNAQVHGTFSVWGLSARYLLFSALKQSRTALSVISLSNRSFLASRRPLAQMIRIDALLRTVDRIGKENPEARLVLLDEGPVFAFAWLDVFYPDLRSAAWRRWRRKLIAKWAPRMDLIVRLDATDETLEQRIRSRPQEHMVKELSSDEIRQFTRQYREAFDRVLEDFAAEGCGRVVGITTEENISTANAEADRYDSIKRSVARARSKASA